MPLVEERGVVSIWLWSDADQDEFAEYVREQAYDPSLQFSAFAVDLGVDSYDPEQLASAFGIGPLSIAQLLAEGLWSESFREPAERAARELGIASANGIILLYDFRWSGPWESPAPTRHIGCHSYKSPPWRPELRPTDHRGRVTVAVVSPDGRLGVTAARGGDVFLWDLESGVQIARGGGEHAEWVHDLVFAPDGRLVSTGNEVVCWSIDGERLHGRKLGTRGGYQMLGVTIDPQDPGAALAICVDGSLTRWRLDGGPGEVVAMTRGRLTGLAIGRDARIVTKWNESGGVVVFRGGEEQWSLPPDSGAHNYLAIAGRNVVFGRPDGVVAHDLATGERVGQAECFAMCIAAHADASWVVMGTERGRLHVWNLVDAPTASEAHAGPIYGLAIASELSLILSVAHDGTAALRNAQLELLAKFEPAPAIRHRPELWRHDPWALGVCAGRRDGSRWLVGSHGGQVHVLVWDGRQLVAISPASR